MSHLKSGYMYSLLNVVSDLKELWDDSKILQKTLSSNKGKKNIQVDPPTSSKEDRLAPYGAEVQRLQSCRPQAHPCELRVTEKASYRQQWWFPVE